jgi:hypothetical protein
VVAVETRAADNTEEDEEEVEEEVEEKKEEEGRGLRVVQEAMSKLFAYAEGGSGTRSNTGRGRVRRGRRRRWNDDGGGRESATMVAMVTPR